MEYSSTCICFNAGGLTAVMWTDTIQAFILIGGSAVLTIMGKINIYSII